MKRCPTTCAPTSLPGCHSLFGIFVHPHKSGPNPQTCVIIMPSDTLAPAHQLLYPQQTLVVVTGRFWVFCQRLRLSPTSPTSRPGCPERLVPLFASITSRSRVWDVIPAGCSVWRSTLEPNRQRQAPCPFLRARKRGWTS